MALIDKASLLMVPSTYEAGKLYNVLPSGNRAPDSTDQNSGYDQTRADFDFDRGSNAAATRVNAAGLIEKYRENLLLQSNNFGTTWGTTNASVTGGQEGYNGTNDAWKFVGNTNASRHYILQSISKSAISTLSLYAKASGHNYIQFGSGSTVNQYVNFDLSNGSVGNIGSDFLSATTEDLGNGWYRLSVSNKAIINGFYISLVSSKAAGWLESWTMGNATDGILIQNAQLETGLVATDYLNSGATTAKAGVLVDLPRINYDANGNNGALILEPQRANLIPQTEYLGDWSLTNGTLITNATISPDGTKNAGRVVFNNTGLDLKRTISVTASTTYTYSFYIKLESGAGLQGRFYDNSNGANIEYYDYTSQISGTDWSRITRTFTTPSGCTEIQVWLLAASSSIVTASFWGAQIEAGSYATSYIPNHGASGGVTRALDVCTTDDLQTLNVFNGSEGALLFEGVRDGQSIFSNFVVTANSNTTKSLLIDNSNNTIRLRVFNASAAQEANIITSTVGNGRFKYLIKWNAGALAVYLNGSSVATDTITAYSYTNVNLKEGNWSNNYVKQFTLFDEVPTDAECVTLTTL